MTTVLLTGRNERSVLCGLQICNSDTSTPCLQRNMSLPPTNPEKTSAGIVRDPQTLERVVPSSTRKDGT